MQAGQRNVFSPTICVIHLGDKKMNDELGAITWISLSQRKQ
jgi:hypothetical protein